MYRPSRPATTRPKLHGACELLPLLDLAWRREPGHTSPRNVTGWAEGLVFVEVEACDGQLWPLIEVSPDARRWADRLLCPAVDAPGFYAWPVGNIGAFLRVSYRLDGAVKFSIEWLGKSFEIGRPTSGILRQ